MYCVAGCVLAPLIHVPQRIKQAQIVGKQARDGPGSPLAVAQLHAGAQIPGIFPQETLRGPVVPAGHSPGAGCILPFGVGWQAVSARFPGVGLDPHPRGILALLVRLVALPQVLLPAQPVAIGRGVIPAHSIHGAFRIRAVLVVDGAIDPAVLLHEGQVLLDGHFRVGDGETVGDDLLVGELIAQVAGAIVESPRLPGRRAHAE
jgi:hypothetical protein